MISWILDENALTGPIPSELGLLTDMTLFTLGKSFLVHSTSIAKIRFLHLTASFLISSSADNALTGSVPSELHQLTNSVIYLGTFLMRLIETIQTLWKLILTLLFAFQAVTDPAKLLVGTDSTILLERYIAVLFYFATQGDGWTDQTGWLSENPLCSWYGLECTDEGFLRGMDLGTCLLSSFCLCSKSVRSLTEYALYFVRVIVSIFSC
jgi:hypothetical protein